MTDQNGGDDKPTLSNFISRLMLIILSNIVPIYGVLRLGWDSFSLVLLFILEGVMVLVIDADHRLFPLRRTRSGTAEHRRHSCQRETAARSRRRQMVLAFILRGDGSANHRQGWTQSFCWPGRIGAAENGR
ncbi:hypothetical protein JXA02_03775 [candidate division KSB1 bacterium]|nr:hypothetical protein [candidate division KSB1 bacterium]RQW09282.1 MAG: hypothetical protein EH222_04240 [candidate division KSB1 bacterium]